MFDTDRFNKFICQGDGCWHWTGNKNKKGYGIFWHNGANRKAHRVSYELHIGSIPEGLFVLHKCDNPSCVNPEHLFIGTNMDNVQDAVRKGRLTGGKGNPGESHPKSKLTLSQVMLIKSMPRGGLNRRILAKSMGVSVGCIAKIRSGENWGVSL